MTARPAYRFFSLLLSASLVGGLSAAAQTTPPALRPDQVEQVNWNMNMLALNVQKALGTEFKPCLPAGGNGATQRLRSATVCVSTTKSLTQVKAAMENLVPAALKPEGDVVRNCVLPMTWRATEHGEWQVVNGSDESYILRYIPAPSPTAAATVAVTSGALLARVLPLGQESQVGLSQQALFLYRKLWGPMQKPAEQLDMSAGPETTRETERTRGIKDWGAAARGQPTPGVWYFNVSDLSRGVGCGQLKPQLVETSAGQPALMEFATVKLARPFQAITAAEAPTASTVTRLLTLTAPQTLTVTLRNEQDLLDGKVLAQQVVQLKGRPYYRAGQWFFPLDTLNLLGCPFTLKVTSNAPQATATTYCRDGWLNLPLTRN